MVLPVLALLGFELILRLSNVGHAVRFLLPVDLNGKPFFVQNDRFGERFFGPIMARQPWPLTIPADKPADTTRIFVFGESAAYGDPQPEFGLPRMLQAMLEEKFPGARFEVLNAAMTAINSHVILPIARDCAARQGGIWVIYMGNNEVVGPYGAGTVFGPKGASMALIRSSLAARSTRIGQCLEKIAAAFDHRDLQQKEWGGMEMFLKQPVRRDDSLMTVVYSNFERNLSDILRAGRRSGARIVVSTVASNLKDCPPFASLHRKDLPAADLTRWEKLYRDGASAQQTGKLTEALEDYRQAALVDGEFAELRFRIGKCSLALGHDPEALSEFAAARDEDALRFRCDSRLNSILRQAVTNRADAGVLLADTEEVFTHNGIPKTNCFYEHVHLTFEGNYFLALTLARQIAKLLPEEVARRGPPGTEWPSIEACARRLGWSDWFRYQGEREILGRIGQPPFTLQFDQTERLQKARTDLERLLPATGPDGLRAAASACIEALSKAPQDWVLLKNLAQLQARQGDFAGAAASWRRILAVLPHSTEAWEGLGIALAEQKLDSEAETAFGEALKRDPNSPATFTSIGQISARQGKPQQALERFEAALKIKPYYTPAHYGAGKALEALGRPEEARAHYQQALQTRMLTPASLINLAQLAFEKGWFAAAATNFADALRLDPGDATTHVNLGVTLEALGRHTDAKDHYAEAVRLDPNLAEAHARLGIELGRAGDDASAMKQFAEAVRLKPDLIEARLDLGIAMANQHLNAEALEQFQEVLRRNPTNAIALKYVKALGSRDKSPSR